MAVIRRFQPRPVRPVSAVGRRAPARRRPRWWRDALGFALPVLALVLAGLWFVPQEQAGALDCTALRVVDGDTLDCAGTRIRLVGIDTPEMPGHCRAGRACTPGDPFAAKAQLQRLAASGVSCRISGEDVYGRALARCRSRAGDLSCAMLASGHAVRRYDRLFCAPLALRG